MKKLRLWRAAPLALAAVAAFVGGTWAGARHEPEHEVLAERWAAAWVAADYAVMHSLLRPADRARVDVVAFSRAFRAALATASAVKVAGARPASAGPDGALVRASLRTRAFGTVRGDVALEFAQDDGVLGVVWDESAVFPGLRRGEKLQRETVLPPRATLLARNRQALARGPERASELEAAASIVGELGPAPPGEQARLRGLGYPDDARVGTSGLERVFEQRLAGTPGGRLVAARGSTASGRVLAERPAVRAPAVRTTIDPRVQAAAAAAIAGRLGGIAVLDPRDGEVLALAGLAFSGLQPPGSTFKIVTLAAALEARVAEADSTYPVATSATVEGREIQNANGESCGGTLEQSFAHSCNSVFAPMGAEVGAARLVAMAERFGFNRSPGIEGAATSTIPPAADFSGGLEAAVSAIGQGRLHATALMMATVAATIGSRGVRRDPTLEFRAQRPARRVVSPRIARRIGRMMRAVVSFGTGTAAAIPGVPVAGKTGTAELRDTSVPPEGAVPAAENDPTDTDAWFAAYAPAGRPRVAVGVLLVAAGAGGETAAPVAREVMLAALRR